MLRGFDEGINAQHRGIYDNHPEYQFRSEIYMTYHDERYEEYRLMQNAILDEVTDAAGESTQEFDENFDVIGLINFNWEHTASKPLSIDNRYQRVRTVAQSKSTIIKNKHAIRYLASKRRSADCQAWHRGLHLSYFTSDSETRICTEFSRSHYSRGQHWQG